MHGSSISRPVALGGSARGCTLLGATLVGWMAAIGPAEAQTLFREDFEHADTGDWSATAPPRCDVIVPFDRGIEPSQELYVGPGGSNTTGDGSAGNPFSTLAHAAGLATPGTAIRILPGTYSGGTFLYDLHGSAAAPIWVGGVAGQARPVIAGGGEGLHLVRARWVVLHDLEVQGQSFNGINADDGGDYGNPLASHHVAFRRLAIHDVGGTGNQDCLKLSGIYDFWVLDSTFEACGGGISGSGVDCVGCHRGLVARNRFQSTSGNAVQVKGGSSDIELRWNHLVSPGQRGFNMGGSTGFEFFRPPLSTTEPNAEARRILALGNLIEGGVAAFAFVGCVDCVAAHNTIVEPDNWLFRILQETLTSGSFEFEPSRNGLVRNNLFYFVRGDISTHLNIGPNTDPASFQFRNNLWFAADDPGQSQPSLPSVEIGGVYGQDPLLEPDGSIPGASPAAGAGHAQPWLGGDRAGSCYLSPPSIGAYEVR
ncbi:MAG TPA: right-handed parallel beta-helix repeat-containing protein [Thermoanaerobaculia bacterium]|nr:right-handed parallel beta-helix repeat-containing protein [Thermoanaerobaculia bacterium]